MSKRLGSGKNGGSSGETDNIRVFLRIRPPMGRELTQPGHTFDNIKTDPVNKTIVNLNTKRESLKTYNFHKVFDQNVSQEEVYENYAKEAVQKACEGYHGVLFVYGQTGSGKTFTIANTSPGQEGVLPRAVKELWTHVRNDKNWDYQISVTFVQLYNESLTDMLNDDVRNNGVRLSGVTDRRNDIMVVSDKTQASVDQEVLDEKETMHLFNKGNKNREQASTVMNHTSSRSHTAFIISVRKQALREGASGNDGQPSATLGKLVICDLAGSERVKKTEAKGKQLTEAQSINSSLLILGRVVEALTDKKTQHAPFRESKLTRLLQYSLSGWGKTSIIVNVSPADDNTDETHAAIRFGQRAIQIKQDSMKHTVTDYKALYMELQAQLDERRDVVVAECRADLEQKYEEEIRQLKEKIQLLEEENRVIGGGGGGMAISGMGLSGEAGSLVSKMKSTIQQRERTLQAKESELEEVRRLLKDLEDRYFALGVKHRDLHNHSRNLYAEQQAKIDEYSTKLRQIKGTDFFDKDNHFGKDNVLSPSTGSPVSGGVDSATSSQTFGEAMHTLEVGGGGLSNEDREKMKRFVNMMREEIATLNIYNDKARRSIKMLCTDRENLSEMATPRRSLTGGNIGGQPSGPPTRYVDARNGGSHHSGSF